MFISRLTDGAYRYMSLSLANIISYFSTLNVSYHDVLSLFGFFTFLIIANQLLSGIMLSFSLVPESMVIPLIREEEDLEDLYIDDFFWLHERGVDLIFIFVFIHLFRKLYINVCDLEQEYSWKSGAFAFLIIQVVVFMGLVLCCTHLSEITLTIAANALHTFFFFKGKPYWWFFTDRLLNTDTIIRLAYGHYVLAFYLSYLGLVHGVDMHYDWKTENNFDGVKQELNWWEEVLSKELGKALEVLIFVGIVCFFLYEEPEALSYEIFMWGDVGMTSDVRFYGVAPHWYFRPYMAWLIACPYHRIGIFGLVFFFVVIYFQVNIIGFSELMAYRPLRSIGSFSAGKDRSFGKFAVRWTKIYVENSLYYLSLYSIFFIAIMCTLTYLPYGRFYNRLGGNFAMLFAYLFIFSYLGLPYLRYSNTLSLGSLVSKN